MQYALDSQNIDIVYPASLAVRRRIYLCPYCKEKVTVRSIDEFSKKQPYFAHLKGLGNIDCENYVQSKYSHNNGSLISKALEPVIFKDLSVDYSKIGEKSTKNLYLKINDNVWELFFSFHIYVAHSRWDGLITINGLNGVKIFNSNTISSEQYFVQVDFEFNESNIGKDGHVDDTIFNFIINDLPEINGETNIFNAPYSSGKLLKESDNLYIGETYIVALKNSYKILPVLDDLFQHQYIINNIDFYQINLTDSMGSEIEFTLESFLGKNIQAMRPSIKLLDPLPERFGFDGTIYVSKNTKNLVISYDCAKDFLDWSPLNGIKEHADQHLDESTLIINVSNLNGINLYWNNCLIFRIVKTYTKPIDISALTLINGGNRFNLINSELIKSELIKGEFAIDLASSVDNKTFRIRENVGNSLLPIIKNKLYHFGDGLEIDAGSFGYYLFFESKIVSCIIKNKAESEETISSKEKWLKSINLLHSSANVNSNGLEFGLYLFNITNSHYLSINKSNLNSVIK